MKKLREFFLVTGHVLSVVSGLEFSTPEVEVYKRYPTKIIMHY